MATTTKLSTLNEPAENVKVWDTAGKVHEMSNVNANDMVQHMGWSKNAPANAAPAAKVEAPAPKAEPEKAPVAEAAEDEGLKTRRQK